MMKKSNIYFKKILFILIMIVLFFPLITGTLKIKSAPLQGAIIPATDKKIDIYGWFSGEYQFYKEKYLNENFGLRNFFFRLNNQIAFSLFNLAKANGVIVGKKKYLYELKYIDTYYGRDFIGESKIEQKIEKIKFVQDTLAEFKKSLILIFAPGKAYFYPEYIPDRFKNEKHDSKNYEVWVKELDKYQIDYIGFNQFFKTHKTKAKYQMNLKSGYHWSCYSFGITADSLFSYIRKRYEYELPQFEFLQGEETSTNFRYTDNDQAKLLNVYYSSPEWKLYYPEIEFINSLEEYRPNVLVIGDSYMQSFFGFYPFYDRIFSQNSLLWVCYLDEIWPTLVRNIDKSQLISIIASKDLIILEATDVNNWNFAYGFINDAYYFLTTEGFDYNTAVNNYMNSIRNSPNWTESTRLQAKQDNVTYEEMVKRNAIWMVQQEINNKL